MPRTRRDKPHMVTRARARELTVQTVQRARSARRELLLVLPLTAAVLFAYLEREALFGIDRPVRIAAGVLFAVLGAVLARDLARFVAPALLRRMDAPTAGTLGFVLRLGLLIAVAVVSLRIAGIGTETLAVGGAITAVVVGLAAQQTFGNVFAGAVLTSARPFRVGDRVRLQAGGVAGTLEGTVTALGLLYTTFSNGEDLILVPNSIVMSAAVVPLREPAGVDLVARLRPDVRVADVEDLLAKRVRTPVRGEPHIALEQLDRDEVVMRISATPEVPSDGRRLADEVLEAIATVAREGHTEERRLPRFQRANPNADAGTD